MNDDMDDGLVCAYHIAEDGSARELSREDVKQINEKPSGPGWYWLHWDVDEDGTTVWLDDYKGMLQSVGDALDSKHTRPRCNVYRRGILLILRGINFNPGADPEDMLSVRVWMNDKIVITTRREKLRAVAAIRDSILKGDGPASPSDLVLQLTEGLVARMNDTIEEIDEELEKLEDDKVLETGKDSRDQLFQIRRRSIQLLRFIRPQRPALENLLEADSEYIDREETGRVRIMANNMAANIEELESIRDRAVAMHDAVSSDMNERMNRAMYLLAIVTAIFLPLTLFTGMLGINVGGMPGEGWAPAFWLVLLIMGGMGYGTWHVMKKYNLI